MSYWGAHQCKSFRLFDIEGVFIGLVHRQGKGHLLDIRAIGGAQFQGKVLPQLGSPLLQVN